MTVQQQTVQKYAACFMSPKCKSSRFVLYLVARDLARRASFVVKDIQPVIQPLNVISPPPSKCRQTFDGVLRNMRGMQLYSTCVSPFVAP